jgi:dipeptide/tripeptide permease
MKNLIHLQLQSNQIEFIEKYSFYGMISLVTLFLSSNKLKVLKK